MGKSATLNLRVDPEVKEQAEAVLEQLGVPMSTAVDIFLRQAFLAKACLLNEVLFPKHIKTGK